MSKKYAVVKLVNENIRYVSGHRGKVAWTSSAEEAEDIARCIGGTVVDAEEFARAPQTIAARLADTARQVD